MSWVSSFVRRHVPQARGKSLTLTSGINKLTYNATDLFGTVIDPFKNPLTKDIFGREGVLDVYGAMNFSSNIFSNTHQLTNKFQTGLTEELSKFSSGMGMDQWGGKIQDGLKPRNIGVPSYNGATSPNMDWFDKGSGNLTDAISKGFGNYGLAGKGWLQERFMIGGQYINESFSHGMDFLKDPADKIKRDTPNNSGGGEWNVSVVDLKDNTMRGAGTLKGRAATLKLNKGAKGYGRSSLKIGYGSGPGSGGGIKKWSSAQYASGHRTEN